MWNTKMGNFFSATQCEVCNVRVGEPAVYYMVTFRGLGKYHNRTFCPECARQMLTAHEKVS